MDFPPLAVYAAFEAARPGKWLQLVPGDRIKRVSNQKVARLPSKCVEIESRYADRSVCFYPDGTLAAIYTSTGWSYEYSEYSTFENARLPGKIRVSENRSPVAELHLDAAQLPGTGDVRDEISNPAMTLGWCEGLTLPMVTRKVAPNYPEVARQTQTQGTVDLYGIIAADGRVQGLRVVRTAGALLDKSSADAVSQWVYGPAMCGAEPVAAESIISIHYTLSP